MDYSLLTPEIVGPNWWFIIHTMTLNATNSKLRQVYITFIEKLVPNLFPCEKCRVHARENLRVVPDPREFSQNENKLLQWTIILHNKVNNMGQKHYFDENKAMELYIKGFPLKIHFMAAWFTIHSAAATVSMQNKEKFELFKLLVYGIATSLMATQEFRDSLIKVLKTAPKLEHTNPEKLVEWTYIVRNRHSQVLNLQLSVDNSSIKKFTTPCPTCSLE